nr:hypothetical protein [Tanacetum cinerariifolium]
MEAIEKRFGGNAETKKVQKTLLKQQYENFTGSSSESLDQIHDRLQKLISQLEILRVSLSQEDINLNLKIYEKSSSSASTSTKNIAFVSSSNTDSTNELVSVVASVSAVSAKIPIFPLPNVDSLINAVIYLFFASQSNSPQLDNDYLKQIDAGDLEEMDLKWQMVMKGHFARECRSPKDTRRNGAAEPQRRNVPKRNLLTMLSWPSLLQVLLLTLRSDESLPPSPIYDRYQSGNGYHAVPPPYTGTFMPLKADLVFNNAPNDVETDHPAFNVKLSPTKPDNDLSHTHRPSIPIIEDWLSDSEDESESSVEHVETSVPTLNSKTAILKHTSNGKHGNRKACFVCKSLDHLIKDCDYHDKKMAQTTARNNANIETHKQYAQMTLQNPQRHVVPTAVLTQSKLVPITVVRPVTTAVPKPSVTKPRQAKTVVTKPNSPPRRHINRSPSPKASTFPPKVTAVKAPMGNPQHDLKDNGVINSGCSRHMTGNMSYLSDFEELNGGYVAFGGNPKGGKISGKGKIRTGNVGTRGSC